MKKRVLFLCTHNSCRSQMAEALLRFRCGDVYDAYSAGTEISHVNPWAIRVMAERGVDLSGQVSEHLSKYVGQQFDAVVTTCDSAHQACPVFPGAKTLIHHSFRDPSGTTGSDEEILEVFRQVRDEIDAWIQETFAAHSIPERSES